MRSAVTEVATNAGQLVEVGRRFVDVARTFARGTAPNSPLNATVSRNRRFTVAAIGSTTTAWFGRATTATSTTSCWPWWPGRCGTG